MRARDFQQAGMLQGWYTTLGNSQVDRHSETSSFKDMMMMSSQEDVYTEGSNGRLYVFGTFGINVIDSL